MICSQVLLRIALFSSWKSEGEVHQSGGKSTSLLTTAGWGSSAASRLAVVDMTAAWLLAAVLVAVALDLKNAQAETRLERVLNHAVRWWTM